MALTVIGQLEDWLRFSRIGFTAARALSLLRHFGSPARILGASEAALSAATALPAAMLEKVRQASATSVARDLDIIEKYQVKVYALDDDGFPGRLRTISDPPPVVYLRGNVDDCGESGVAMVGTRRASTYGRLVAERLAGDLARCGLVIISGMARGIDTAAHQGALRVGGRTVAVCGCGLDVPYPRENGDLIERIVAGNGAALSEFPLGTYPEAWHFPARNRVISALSLAVLVVEAPENSGAMITADFAAEQGRDVMAVPGNIDSGKFRGCHRLIKDGARLVESAEDVLQELNLVAQPRLLTEVRPGRPQLSPLENRILRTLSLAPRHIDEVTRDAQLTAAQASATLLQLEIKGLARKLPGSLFVRTA